jgi:hypothetical protein
MQQVLRARLGEHARAVRTLQACEQPLELLVVRAAPLVSRRTKRRRLDRAPPPENFLAHCQAEAQLLLVAHDRQSVFELVLRRVGVARHEPLVHAHQHLGTRSRSSRRRRRARALEEDRNRRAIDDVRALSQKPCPRASLGLAGPESTEWALRDPSRPPRRLSGPTHGCPRLTHSALGLRTGHMRAGRLAALRDSGTLRPERRGPMRPSIHKATLASTQFARKSQGADDADA